MNARKHPGLLEAPHLHARWLPGQRPDQPHVVLPGGGHVLLGAPHHREEQRRDHRKVDDPPLAPGAGVVEGAHGHHLGPHPAEPVKLLQLLRRVLPVAHEHEGKALRAQRPGQRPQPLDVGLREAHAAVHVDAAEDHVHALEPHPGQRKALLEQLALAGGRQRCAAQVLLEGDQLAPRSAPTLGSRFSGHHSVAARVELSLHGKTGLPRR
eukprot:8761263-Lingulodinium_polyedra.AAC.1